MASADHQTEEYYTEWVVAAEPEPPPRPVFARRIALKRKTTCAKAFDTIFADCRRQIVTNRRLVLAGNDPEAVHQLRVGLTRLRAALRAFRPLVGAVHANRLGRLARDMARCVGELRDADVLIADVVARAADGEHADAQAMAALRAALVEHRDGKRREAVAALTGDTWSALRLELAQWPDAFSDGSGLDTPVRRWSRSAMAKQWARVARLGKHLDTLAPEERHELRKALKQLRYATEFFRTVFPKGEVRPFVRRLKTLQDVFGYLNDVELARQLQVIAAEGRLANDDSARAAGFVLGWHAARAELAWDEARAEWHRLARGRRFWK